MESAKSHYSRQRDKGTAFERLCQAFLTHGSVWSQTLEPPVFWSEWAAEREGFDPKDTGVDLVAKLRNEDGWCAIQCKFRNQGGTVSKGGIDSFISASGSAEFTSRILIDTTGRSLGSNAESAMRRQDRPVTRIGLSDLRTKDKHSGIVNDPNAWFGNPRDLIAAIQRIVHLSVETTQSIYWLPEAISADDPEALATKAHFDARAHRAAQAIADSPGEADDQAFVDAITDWNDE